MPTITKTESCPVESISRILGTYWTLQLIHHLRTPIRFCELQTIVGNINPTTLTCRLKFLEEEEIIERIPLSQNQHIAQYQLTNKGQGLLPIIDELVKWADLWRSKD